MKQGERYNILYDVKSYQSATNMAKSKREANTKQKQVRVYKYCHQWKIRQEKMEYIVNEARDCDEGCKDISACRHHVKSKEKVKSV